MDTQDYVNELNAMYSRFYCGDKGYCKYWENCRNKNDNVRFYSDRVKIGKNYGKSEMGKLRIPKIVFVGLEGLHGSEFEKCIPPISLNNPNSQPSLDAQNNHYRGVRYVLSYLITKLNGISTPDDATVESLEKINDTQYLTYYSLANTYKCAFGLGKSTLTHTTGMQKHCQEIFFEELKILHPDILVIQVVTSRPDILQISGMKEKFVNGKEIKHIERNGVINNNTISYKFSRDDGTPLYCIWTYHGNGGPYYRKQGGVFVNNKEYILKELNPVLNATIDDYSKSIRP